MSAFRDACASIKPEDLIRYLESKGWTQAEDNYGRDPEQSRAYLHPSLSPDDFVEVSMRPDFIDYPRRVADVVRGIEQVEERWRSVIEDIARPGWIETGRKMRRWREGLDRSMGQEARRRGLTVVQISDMERGNIEPIPSPEMLGESEPPKAEVVDLMEALKASLAVRPRPIDPEEGS